MTDNEIIKALECCTIREMDCKNCLNKNQGLHCIYETMKLALNLINRQKAEIERVGKDLTEYKLRLKMSECTVDEIKSEAIKEFAERLKEHRYGELNNCISFSVGYLDNLVKEMTDVER